MGIAFNHTIVHSENREESARFFTEVFGLPEAVEAGPFLNVALEYGGNLDFATIEHGQLTPQHYRLPGIGRRLRCDLRPDHRPRHHPLG